MRCRWEPSTPTRQKLIEPANRVIGDAGEDIGEPSLRVDVVEPCRLDQRVGDRGALATAIRAAEEPRFTPERYTTQRPFRGFAREADSAIVEEAGERAPAAQHVVDGLRNVVVAGNLGELRVQPLVKFGHSSLSGADEHPGRRCADLGCVRRSR